MGIIFQKEHPILMRTVELIVDNIEKGLYKNDIEKLTGPKIYAKSIENFLLILKIQTLYGKILMRIQI